jgi:hypothetical protein
VSSETPQVGVVGGSAAAKASRRVLRALLILAVLVVLASAAAYFAGGLDYLRSYAPAGWTLGSPGKAPAKDPSPALAAATTTSTLATVSTTELQLPPGVSPDLAKRMYVEQIQSQVNLGKMADGEITRFRVVSVKSSKTGAAVFVTAYFADGTEAPGVMQLVKREGVWYFMSFTGLRRGELSGSADTVQDGTIEEGRQSDAVVVQESGITVFDYGVINTFLAEQVANQTLITAVIDGAFTELGLGRPVDYVGTTSVPCEFSGKGTQRTAGTAVLIDKTVDSQNLTFLTSFRAN